MCGHTHNRWRETKRSTPATAGAVDGITLFTQRVGLGKIASGADDATTYRLSYPIDRKHVGMLGFPGSDLQDELQY